MPEDAEQSNGLYSSGFQWTIETHGPMQNHHAQTWIGDDRTEAQKEAAKKHSKHQKKFAITPTKKGDKLSDEHRQALRVPRPGAGKHNNHVKGDSHFAKQTTTCPHCGKQGGGGSMKRWHFDNCKHNK